MQRRGFTLVEVLVVVGTVSVLASLVVINTNRLQAQARDSRRRASVDAYVTSMEQWRLISPTKSYFVQLLGQSCTASGPINLTANDRYMSGTGSGCVGYQGGGAGRMTRRQVSSTYPGSQSIAEALREVGVLNGIRVDPLDDRKEFTDASARDFILTTCTNDGAPASNPEEAQQYAVFAQLELPTTSSTGDIANARVHCGGEDNGITWETIR